MISSLGTLKPLHAWFGSYCRSFQTREDEQVPLGVKIVHCQRVRKEMVQLARALRLSEEMCWLAEITGLLHDIGRFEQFRRYHTFADSDSEDHAAMGVAVLERENILKSLEKHQQQWVKGAIANHNREHISDELTGRALLLAQMIRDADKLDIWRVFAECYQSPDAPDRTVVHSLPDRPTWDEHILAAITRNEMAKLQHMRSLNDMKLLQLSWVFDINFPETFVLARKNGHFLTIARSLPDAPAVQQAIAITMDRLAQAGIPN